jgi:hypothetical protein
LEIDKLQLLEAIESEAIESSWGRVRLRVEAYRLHLESCNCGAKVAESMKMSLEKARK